MATKTLCSALTFPVFPRDRESHQIIVMERIAIIFEFWEKKSDTRNSKMDFFFLGVIVKEKPVVKKYQESKLDKTWAFGGRIERQK